MSIKQLKNSTVHPCKIGIFFFSVSFSFLGILMIVIPISQYVFESLRHTQPFKERKKPNVILISLDTLRRDHVSCYGYARHTTPTIDRIALASVLFENCFSQSKWTLPSHMTMLTSLYPPVHRVIDQSDVLDPNRTILAQILKREGYYNAAFVDSSPEFYVGAKRGFSRGFEIYEHFDERLGKYSKPLLFTAMMRAGEFFGKRYIFMAHFHAKSITNAVINWLNLYKHDAPFFLFLHYYDIHMDWGTDSPYISPSPHDRQFCPNYDGAFFRKSASYKNGAEFLRVIDEHVQEGGDLSDMLTPEDLEFIIAQYDGGIAYVDQNLERLKSALQELGIWDNTLLIITSDHGEEFFEHLRFDHKQYYDEVLRVPLIMHFPKHWAAPKRITASVQLLDLSPTILECLGIDIPIEFQGKSLLSLIGGDEIGDSVVFSGGDIDVRNSWVVRRNGYKLLKNDEYIRNWRYQHGREFEVYDTGNDPAEQADLTITEPGRLQQMTGLLDSLIFQSHSFSDSLQWEAIEVKTELSERTKKQIRALGYVR